MRTPDLLAFDDSLTVLSVPYGLYERVRGNTLERLELEPMVTRDAYREVGRDLARLHQGVLRQGALAELTVEPLPEPELWPVELAEQGYLGVLEADWLSDWMAGLRRMVAEGVPAPPVFRHGDMQASNIMVEASLSYAALLDWGACGWGDAAHDVAGLPLAVVPFLLEGYRELWSLPEDGSFEAGIVLRQLQIALFLLRRPPQPDKSWAERPLGILVDLLRVLGGRRTSTSDDCLASECLPPSPRDDADMGAKKVCSEVHEGWDPTFRPPPNDFWFCPNPVPDARVSSSCRGF